MPRNEAQELLESLPPDGGAVPAVIVDIPDLPYVRLTQRVRPPRARRSLWTLLALVLLGHVLLAWLGYLVLKPSPYTRVEGGVFMVTLIDSSSELPPPPPLVEPPALPGQPPPPLVHREAPAPGAITATMEGVVPPRLKLYDSNGQIRLSTGAAKQPAPAQAYSAPTLKGSQIYSGKSPVPYKPTRFNQDWAPDHETLGAKTVGRAFDKAVEKTTVVKTVHLPGGLKVKCGVSPLLLVLGCQPPPPPSAPPDELENDVRLSMPPPTTLTGKNVPLPSSASSVPAPASGTP